MKNTKLSELPIVPEEYDVENFEHVEFSKIAEGMTNEEQKFVHGLIRYYEPKNLLEIGVASGCGTVNILNAISDRDSKLVSVDIVEEGVGSAVTNNTEKWRLLTGVDPSQVMEQLDMKFDFCVIDAFHIHPGECLNFISVLPWLKDGAIVIVHDTIGYIQTIWTSTPCYAPRILISSVCADKLEPDFDTWLGQPNICAFQVAQDTRKYIQNIFDALFFPWGSHILDFVLPDVRSVVEKHYGGKQLNSFDKSIKFNKRLDDALSGYGEFYKLAPHDAIIYGAGFTAKHVIGNIKSKCDNIPYTIWDINADKIQEIHGIPVTCPDFNTPAKDGRVMVITIVDNSMASQIRAQFEPLGYKVYHGILEFIKSAKL